MLIQFQKTSVTHLGDVVLLKTAFRERCFIYQSFGKQVDQFGDMTTNTAISFLADSGEGTAAEWEPRYGPIQKWEECDEDWKGEDCFGREIGSRRHWHFPFVKDESAGWSQLAVERECLKEELHSGGIGAVFDVLEKWSKF